MAADTGEKKENKKPLLRLIGLGKNKIPQHQKNPGGKDVAVELQQVEDQNRQTGQPESKHVVLQQLWQDKPNTLLKHIREGKLEAVKLVFAPLDGLSKKQQFATARDDEGNSLFLLAAKHGQYEVCQWLWAQNLAVREDRNTEKMTALLLAAQSGYNNIVRWLLDKEESKAKIQESANGKNALL